jgi:hypothetical protein
MKNILCKALIVIMYASAIQAESITLQNGINNYNGCSDTYLIMTSEKNVGSNNLLVVEGYHCSSCIDQRALIRFDLSSIPTTTPISKATLSLFEKDQPRPGRSSIRVFKVNKAWDENSATWTLAKSGQKWVKAGGDYSTPAETTYSYSYSDEIWHNIDITTAIKGFVKSPETNFGLMLYMIPAMYTVRYISANGTDISLRPKLTIETADVGIKINKSILTNGNLSYSLQNNHSLVIYSSQNPGSFLINNLKGQQLLSGLLNTPKTSIDISNIQNGKYIITIRENQKKSSTVLSIYK